MTLTREAIVEGLSELLGAGKVDIDEQTLKENSLDRYRKLEDIFGIYDLPIPAAVVRVEGADDVATTLAFCNEHGINVVPKTGGTATEGGLETIAENSIVLDGKGMNQIIKIDEVNMQATVQCGVKLQDLEDQVRALGLTTGHSPQSKPIAMFGGLVATRSIGQFSTLYGGLETWSWVSRRSCHRARSCGSRTSPAAPADLTFATSSLAMKVPSATSRRSR